MATETAQLAQACGDPSVAEAYMGMAAIWVKMAEEIRARAAADEAAARRAGPDEPGAADGPPASA